jgi:hypothetical protein
MTSKLSCNPWAALQGTNRTIWIPAIAALILGMLVSADSAWAGDAPQWMRALVNVPLPAHDEKTNAVLLLSEDSFIVQSNGKIKRIERRVYKILRPDGKSYGTVIANFDSESKINFIHGWCIPAQGKDYEIKDKDALETGLFGV